MRDTDNQQIELDANQPEIDPELLIETTWTRSLSEHEREFNEREGATTTTSK